LPTGAARIAFVVELLLCLALPGALLLAGAVLLPVLLIALPTDMAASPSPLAPALLCLKLLLGVGGGGLGFYGIFQLARRQLTGRPPAAGRAALRAMLLCGVAALAIAVQLTGPSNARAWVLLVALPGGLIAHLCWLSRDVLAGRP
jgi:hypothetical protein